MSRGYVMNVSNEKVMCVLPSYSGARDMTLTMATIEDICPLDLKWFSLAENWKVACGLMKYILDVEIDRNDTIGGSTNWVF